MLNSKSYITNEHWYTSLLFAVQIQQNEVLDLIIHRGNFVLNQIWSLTRYAISNGNTGAVKVLGQYPDYNYLQNMYN